MSYQSVLIIHDSKPERELLKQFVAAGSDKITVKDVASESEADQLLSLQSFDIVLSSIIHKRFADLSRKGTHVIILIPEESPEILSKLAGLGLCNYQVFPIRQEVLRDQINTLTRNGVARKYPRFDVPGTKVFFHVGITDIEGKILNISEEGILCELTVEGNYDYLLKDICLTIKFPWKYGNRILKELRCNYLATRKAQKDGFKTTLHLVLLLPKLQGTHLEAFKKTLRKIIKKQHPAVIWSTRRLEVTFLKSTYYFYKIHLFRIFLLASLVIAPVVFLIIYLSEEKPEVVWTNGQIYSRSEDDSIWKKEKEKFLPSDNYIRIADGEPEKRGKPDDKDMSPAPGNHTAVLRYTHHESVLLSKEGTVRRKKQGKEISYQLKGAIHLMLQPRNDKVPHRLIINGFKLSTISARLFFQDLTSPAKLTIVEGSIYIYAQQTVFLSLSDEIEPQGEKIILTSGQSVQFTREKIILTPKKDETIRFYNDTYLPGFIADDQYLHIGYAVVETGGFILKRHGRRYQVGVRSIPLMLHDTLITGLNDRVFIRLHTDDLLRLYANGTITIQEFPLPEKYPLLPLIIGVNAQEFTSKSSVGFQFKGRLRSRINPKIRNRRFRMRSTNAVIGVKGTDFEANNTSGKTEVLTISGKVELSDKEEKRSVLISQGMMSHIDENQAPLEPEKIPKELLHRLLRDSLDLEDQLQLSSFNTINPDNIILEADFSVSLYWNTVLSKAEIRLGNKTYPLKIAPNSVEIILNKKMFEGLALKEYKAEIKVMDIRKRSASLDVSLNLKPQMKTVKSKIELSDKIQFEKGGSIIKPESFTLLNEIIKTINENKQIRQVSIEGHTDSDGPEKRNKELSENRANAVRKYLIEHGVPGHILQTKGFGESIPISENTSQAGKAKNRRVEFIIETATLEEE